MIKNPVFNTLLTCPFSLDYLATDRNDFEAILGRGRCLTMEAYSNHVSLTEWVVTWSYGHINLYPSTYSANIEESGEQTFWDTLYTFISNIDLLNSYAEWYWFVLYWELCFVL
jgi:hypothetical protein